MKKIILCLSALVTAFYVSAQTDSLKKFRISGYQLDVALLGSNYKLSSRENFQKFVSNNTLLNSDLGGYTTTNGWVEHSVNFNGHIGGKMYADLKLLKHRKTEVFIGFRYGSVTLAGTYYSKASYDTTGVFVNPANNSRLTMVEEYSSGYNFGIQAQQLLVPFGINLITNKKRWFWFTLGVELAPGITFANKFMASHSLIGTQLVLNDNSNLKDYRTYTRGDFTDLQSETSSKKIKGIGFTGYATLPVSINIRVAKKIKFLRHLNLNGSFAPGVYVNKNRFAGTSSSFVINLATGLKYNF